MVCFYGDNINEILPDNTLIFPVPGCPASLPGVINLRGDIESVIHIGQILLLDEETSKAKTILLGQGKTMRSGLYVDAVIDVVDVLKSDIQTTPNTLAEQICPFFLGVLEFSGRGVTLLSLEQIFTDYQHGLG
jgi:purine-binding chemotaxis protein CheW